MRLDPDEIRDARQYAFSSPKQPIETDAFKIFLAVLSAILVAWFLRAAYVEWQLKLALEKFNQQITASNAKALREIELNRIHIQAAAEEQARIQQEAIYQQKLAKKQLELEKQAAINQAIDLKNRKAQAWAGYYKPAKGCEPSNDNKDLMMCAMIMHVLKRTLRRSGPRINIHDNQCVYLR